MRFGIKAMQFDAVVPSNLPSADLMAHVSNFDLAKRVRELHSLGFNPIELGSDLAMFLPHTLAPPAIEGLAALKKEIGMSYTVHLPLWSVEPSTPLTPVREGSVRAVIDTIDATVSLEPETYVLHATGALASEFYRKKLPEAGKSLVLRIFQSNAHESLKTILAETGIPSRQLAIETIEFPFDLTLELAEELDLSMCLDTGHVIVGFSGPIGVFEALERCLPRLAEIHLHDGPWQGPERKLGYGKDHSPLGTGDLDTARLLARLTEAGFAGPLIFELKVEEALASLDMIRSIRPDLL
jgi:sugar phosphate isomerase/epimerase